MIAPFAAELLKLRTIRSTWGYVAAVVGLAALVTAGSIGSESQQGRLETDFQFRLFLDGTAPAVVIGLLLGCIVVTNEFRHGTITPALLVLPRRGVFLLVKLVTGVAAVVGLAAVAALTIFAISVIWLTVLDVGLEPSEIARGVGRGLLAAAVGGAIGAAIGGAVQSQVAALVGILVWTFVAEPLVWVLLGLLDLDTVPDYLLVATVLGLTDSSGDGLSLWLKAAVALAWTSLAGLLAWLRLRRRDIT